MSTLDDDLLRELLATFQDEAAEHLQTINQSLLHMERTNEDKARQEQIREAFRATHSLKGAARAVNMPHVERLSHGMENILQQARDSGVAPDPDTCDMLYDTLDAIEQLLSGATVEIEALQTRLSGTDDTAPLSNLPSTVDQPDAITPIAPGDETIRVSVGKLNDLMAQAGELLVAKISAEQRQADMQTLQYQIGQWPKTWREIKTLLPRVEGDAAQQLSDIIQRHAEEFQTLTQSFNTFSQAVNRDTVRLGMVTNGLQDRVREMRMVPFHTISLLLERAVRDVARSAEKAVNFVIEGGEVELDKKVLEVLKDPLLHLLRNAVSHGIESPEGRKAAGKPEEGQVTLTVSQRGNQARLAVSDDGRGFDLEALRQTSARKGLTLDEDASADDLIGLAFVPGMTTVQEVTAISGRGIGLDVVRQELESIQGRVAVDNKSGEGVTIEMTVPTSLTMTRGLLVRVAGEQYVLPLLSIEKIIELEGSYLVGGKSMITVDETPLSLVTLAKLLDRQESDEVVVTTPMAVIMAVAEQRLALLVDDVLTEQEMAVKPLSAPLQRVRNVTGAALLGDGEPVVILNPADLVKSARTLPSYDIPVKQQLPDDDKGPAVHILVVDDSITTRTLEKNILEMAGYRVTTAINGLEAIKRLEEHAIDLVISDIQMPQLDGFQLTQQIRDSKEHGRLPIILVTSLESQEDREQGMLAGADAYIVKRGFDQAELLATIQQLL
jgi:two-component system chemotaxis sensor kinase CheA